MSATGTAERTGLPGTDSDTRPRKQPPYHVVLLDDDKHTYAYVVHMMQSLFGHCPQKGFQIARKVDTQGRAIVLTTTREHAELKRDQIHAFGPDDLIAGSRGSMRATLEPSEAAD